MTIILYVQVISIMVKIWPKNLKKNQTSSQYILCISWLTWTMHLYTSDDHDILIPWFLWRWYNLMLEMIIWRDNSFFLISLHKKSFSPLYIYYLLKWRMVCLVVIDGFFLFWTGECLLIEKEAFMAIKGENTHTDITNYLHCNK